MYNLTEISGAKKKKYTILYPGKEYELRSKQDRICHSFTVILSCRSRENILRNQNHRLIYELKE